MLACAHRLRSGSCYGMRADLFEHLTSIPFVVEDGLLRIIKPGEADNKVCTALHCPFSLLYCVVMLMCCVAWCGAVRCGACVPPGLRLGWPAVRVCSRCDRGRWPVAVARAHGESGRRALGWACGQCRRERCAGGARCACPHPCWQRRPAHCGRSRVADRSRGFGCWARGPGRGTGGARCLAGPGAAGPGPWAGPWAGPRLRQELQPWTQSRACCTECRTHHGRRWPDDELHSDLLMKTGTRPLSSI